MCTKYFFKGKQGEFFASVNGLTFDTNLPDELREAAKEMVLRRSLLGIYMKHVFDALHREIFAQETTEGEFNETYQDAWRHYQKTLRIAVENEHRIFEAGLRVCGKVVQMGGK